MAGIYKRGRHWWGRVQRNNQDLRRSLETTSQGVARRRLKDWLDELDGAAWGEKPRRRFDELALEFEARHLPRLKPGSRRRYQVSIDALAESFEGVWLDQIATRLGDFEADRRRRGRRIPDHMLGKKSPHGLRPATIRRDLACLSSMFGFAIELEWVEANPVSVYLKRGRKRGLRESPPRRRYLSPAEEQKLLAAAAADAADPNLRDAIILAIDTGLRSDELFGLCRDQVRIEANEIRLDEGTKNARPRHVPLLPRARAVLAQKPAQLKSPYVLVNPATGGRYRSLNRGLAGAARRAGIEPLIWHDLRRTCGCRLLQQHELSMAKVSRWLGHSSVTVTERSYAFLEDEHLQRAIAGTIAGTGAAEK